MKVLRSEDPIIVKAKKEYGSFIESDAYRQLYESRLKFRREQASDLAEARQIGFAEGFAETFAETFAESLPENKEIDREKIIRRATVKAMQKRGIALEDIMAVTSLSKDEIQNL